VFLRQSIEEAIESIADLGFRYIEIWGEYPHLWARDYDAASTKKLIKLLNKYGLSSTYHAPCHDIDLSSVNYGIWQESLRQTIEALEMASELNSDVLVVHAGQYYPGDPPGGECGRGRVIKALEQIIRRAEALGVAIGLENCPIGPFSVLNTVTCFKDLLEDINHPFLGATVDLGHAYLNGEDPLHYVKQMGSHLKHIHLNDNEGDDDTHVPLGRGHVDFKGILDHLQHSGYEGSYIMEIWCPDNPSQAVIESRDHIVKD
jgi:sugar phosphate isomerase/epimerase